MKHAFLVIAHTDFEVLETLLSLLDYKDNDVYVPSCSVIHFEGGSSKNTPSKRSLQISKESSLVYYKYYRHVNPFALMLYKLIY